MTALFRPPIAAAKTIGWRQAFGIAQEATPFWARVRGAQLAMLNRYAPFNVAVMAINLGSLAWLLRSVYDPAFMIGWCAVIAGLASVWLARWWRSRGFAEIREATTRDFWLVNAEVIGFGVAWGALVLRLLPLITIEDQMVLVLLSAITLAACGFATAMLPACGAALAVMIALATVAGLPGWSPLSTPLVWLAFASFALLIIRGTTMTSLSLMVRMRIQADHIEASATIGLLLNEFEAHGSDWLIEVDAHGRLSHVSPRLCEAAGRPYNALMNTPLIGLIGPDRRDPAVRGAIRQLGRHFTTQTPFRHLQVPVAVRGELRWWSIAGTPRFEGRRFSGYRGVGSDVTEARRAADRIAQLARYDPLTGLANRALLRETLGEALRTGGCALLFVDLDRFKQVNDSLGHVAGDGLLRSVADRLRAVAGQGATIGRLGGDEFAVVIPQGSPRRAAALAERIVAALAEPQSVAGQNVTIGASVGYAFGPVDASSVDALLRCADLALYEVKASGRGAACRFEPLLQQRAEERRALEVDLAAALDRGELSLAYQPIVEASDETIVGFEALLRWTHPVLGSIPPVKFIPVAEDTGLIVRIGAWVLREACAWASRWPDHVRIAVNLSAVQFEDPDLPRIVAAALADNGLAPDRLELEITESIFLNETPATAAMIAQLKAMGVRFALDDFGTGYSSLGYLRRADFSRIKIDRSFVQRAAACETESTAIIQAIVALATSLGMTTTAEGTETRAEFEACRSLGCLQVQGYLFGRPMPPEDATALVEIRRAA